MRPSEFLMLGILGAVVSCGGSSSPTGTGNNPPPPTGGINITIKDFMFSPAVDTIKVGTTVQWVNDGPSEHSTTSDAGVWNSQGLTPPSGNGYGGGSTAGATYQFKFTQVGTFTYHCMFHPPSTPAYASFVGKIVVTN